MKRDPINFDEIKKGQIRVMFFTLKILALFFSAVPLYQYFSTIIDFSGNEYSVYIGGTSLGIICLVMFSLMVVFKKKENSKLFQVLEIIIFFVVFVSGRMTQNSSPP